MFRPPPTFRAAKSSSFACKWARRLFFVILQGVYFLILTTQGVPCIGKFSLVEEQKSSLTVYFVKPRRTLCAFFSICQMLILYHRFVSATY